MFTHLVLDLTGESRVTQLQPPLPVWVMFFDLDEVSPQALILTDGSSGARIERPIVRHDHNWTIEIPEVACDRPAIIRFQRTGQGQYTYWVFPSNHSDYDRYDWLLTEFPDPRHTRGRRFRMMD